MTNTKFVIAGPSVMIPQENYKDTSLDFESIDQVFAFRCFSSRIVKYWLSRERKSNKWPPRHIIESVITKGCLTPVLRILQSKLNLIGLVCFKQMHLQKMDLDLFRCLVDVNTYLEIPCKITDLLLEEMGYGFNTIIWIELFLFSLLLDC